MSAPTEAVPEQLLIEDKTSQQQKGSGDKVSDLSKEWGDDEEEDKTEKEQQQGGGKETEESIESIVSFIQEGPGASTGKDKDGAAAASAAAGADGQDKSNKEWVSEIFGDDGKPVVAKSSQAGKNSVNDLNPEGEDFSGEICQSVDFMFIK